MFILLGCHDKLISVRHRPSVGHLIHECGRVYLRIGRPSPFQAYYSHSIPAPFRIEVQPMRFPCTGGLATDIAMVVFPFIHCITTGLPFSMCLDEN